MADVLEVFFDPAADASVRALWRRLDDADVPSAATATHGRHRPHLTLLNVDSLPRPVGDRLSDRLRALLVGLEVGLDVLGVFPGERPALILGVSPTRALIEAHAAVHRLVPGRRAGPWCFYEPDAWVPHCALAVNLSPAAIGRAMVTLCPFAPIAATVAQVGVVDTVSGEHRILAS